jgi:protein-tyrosine phosphatase
MVQLEAGESKSMTKILTVCLGNICRSPAAEAVLKMKLKEHGIEAVVSAGTSGHHTGEMADKRMRLEAAQRGIEITSFSRQFTKDDFVEFDHIIVMDDSNYENVTRLSNDEAHHQKVVKMIDFVSDKYRDLGEVPDPYWGGQQGFSLVLDLLDEACDNFIKSKLSR